MSTAPGPSAGFSSNSGVLAPRDLVTLASAMRTQSGLLSGSVLMLLSACVLASACGSDDTGGTRTTDAGAPASEPVAGAANAQGGDGATTTQAGADSVGAGGDGSSAQGGDSTAMMGGAGPGQGGADAGNGDSTLPQRLIDALAVAETGGSVDLDGDGTIDLVVEVEKDRRTSKIMVGDQVVLVAVRYADGRTEKTGDFDLDGTSDYTEAELHGEQDFSRKTEQDSDFDGNVDWRETFEIDFAAGTTHTLRETLSGATWLKEVEGTNDTGAIAAGATCSAEYPQKDSVNADVKIAGSVRVATCSKYEADAACPSSSHGGCTAAQAKRISKAFADVFSTGLAELSSLGEAQIRETSIAKCLAKREAAFLDALISNVVNGTIAFKNTTGSYSGRFSGTRFGCGISCADDGLVSAGQTDTVQRERVNLNMAQSDAELRDTILHELIHSAGYDGPPGHSDADGDQKDSIYACARWCTGRGKESAANPQGEAETADCFRCSATLQAKKECCGDKTVCIGGCCDGPCGEDGRCRLDACNPKKNGGDFSQCRFEGDSSLIGNATECSAHVQWVYKSTSEGTQVLLEPAGGTTTCNNPAQGCSATPLTATIGSTDGGLVLDFSTDPPTYQGVGNTGWDVTVKCPKSAAKVVPIMSLWFAQDTKHTFTPGGPLPGVVTVPDGALQWLWKQK